MSPGDLRPEVVLARIREIDRLLRVLVEIGAVDRERLERDEVVRAAVERILSQLVDHAVAANGHLVAATTGRAPADYAGSFRDASAIGALDHDLAAELVSSAGLRNVLVHEYLNVDLGLVADAVPLALAAYRRYVIQVAGFLRDRQP